MKLIPDSLAIALASNVFPHPGGPASNIPRGFVKPRAENILGFRTGACDSRLAIGKIYSIDIP